MVDREDFKHEQMAEFGLVNFLKEVEICWSLKQIFDLKKILSNGKWNFIS